MRTVIKRKKNWIEYVLHGVGISKKVIQGRLMGKGKRKKKTRNARQFERKWSIRDYEKESTRSSNMVDLDTMNLP